MTSSLQTALVSHKALSYFSPHFSGFNSNNKIIALLAEQLWARHLDRPDWLGLHNKPRKWEMCLSLCHQ